MRIQILGVPIDNVSMNDAVKQLSEFLISEEQHHVATPNNEMLVEASKHDAFYAVLNSTALSVPDSSGLLLAARHTGQQLMERVSGVDLVQKFCGQLSKTTSVFLLGAGEGVAAKAAETLQSANPHLVIAGTYAGSPRPEDADHIISLINASGAQVLLVAYGAPKQELWIHEHLSKMPSIKIAMGIGGTFDFLAGKITRAPAFMRALHLELLWRLIL